MFRLIIGILIALSGTTLAADFEASERGVALRMGTTVPLVSPVEGLWSVAMDWDEDWPSGWVHAKPDSIEKVGEWTRLSGVMKTKKGNWRVSDAYRREGSVIKGLRRWVWEGKEAAENVTLSVRFQAAGTGSSIVMPGTLYHGNPSGAASGKVAVYTGKKGEEAIFEEHRFPMPYVSQEWEQQDRMLGAALHTLPSPTPHGIVPDQWWSLGVISHGEATEFVSYSGPCASNGMRSVVKLVQPGFKPYPKATLTVPPGGIIEKTFYLQAYPVARAGAGFQQASKAALELMPPMVWDDLPSFEEIIRGKYRFAKTRWLEDGKVAGFKKYPDKDIIVLGWCGQSASLGYALQVLGPQLEGEESNRMAQKSLDFLSEAAYYRDGFRTWYFCDTGKWGKHEPLSQGQAMMNMACAIRAAEKTGLDDSQWRDFLKKSCTFHAKRILQDDWDPRSTDEAFFIAPLVLGHQYFGEQTFMDGAVKAAETYAGRSVNMGEPYWGGTLDAQCEDKEGAWAAFQGFLTLYESTKEQRYLDWAEHAMDVMLTYTVLWDIDMPPGRLRDHNFKTRGWTAVSPQNQHIDVYGVLVAPSVYRMGQLLERDDLKDLALLMFRSCGQLMDPFGSQGEQPQHTNYLQHGDASQVLGHRGDYVETWTVFWITAHFLNAAAQFQELGVALWD